MNTNFLKLKGILAGWRAYSDDELDKLILDESAGRYPIQEPPKPTQPSYGLNQPRKCRGCKNTIRRGKFCGDCNALRIKLQLSRLGWLNRGDSLSSKVRRNGDNRTD